jgi:lysophospholipase L1-like esterase
VSRSKESSKRITPKAFNYLALGDSYTIGESVGLHESFPYQTIQILREKGLAFQAPEIIAKTGWTTDELADNISRIQFLDKYDFVSLLVGVNNQYRGRSVDEYAIDFAALLKKAIGFAGDQAGHVTVLSIPDWGVTPFATGKDRKRIADEIDAFNVANRQIAVKYKVHYIDITGETRKAHKDGSLIANDGLHPSAKEYARWAANLSEVFARELK